MRFSLVFNFIYKIFRLIVLKYKSFCRIFFKFFYSRGVQPFPFEEIFHGKGHIVNFSLCWEPQHQYFSNYFILNLYESLHNEVPIGTAGCMFCINKGGFSL